MPVDDPADRKRLTFAQAEGLAPLPSQMKRTDLSSVVRARLWDVVYKSLQTASRFDGGRRVMVPPLRDALYDVWVRHEGKMGDKFNKGLDPTLDRLRVIFEKAPYADVFGFLQAFIRHPSVPNEIVKPLNDVLESEHAAFRIVDGDTLAPVGSEHELTALTTGLADTAATPFLGAHAHLRKAAESLSRGNFADSVRESIHAVEATARTLEPSAELSKALAKLEESANLHGAMKKAFAALYGYASDEKGIRHPLLDDGDANVDETDALFMLGACAAFVSYLIAKGRAAGLIGA